MPGGTDGPGPVNVDQSRPVRATSRWLAVAGVATVLGSWWRREWTTITSERPHDRGHRSTLHRYAGIPPPAAPTRWSDFRVR